MIAHSDDPFWDNLDALVPMVKGAQPMSNQDKNEPAKFRKKPVVVEAWQYRIHSSRMERGVCICSESRDGHVHTAHNNQLVVLQNGDWILPEPDGIHFYPVKPDIFAATYEPIASEPATAGPASGESTMVDGISYEDWQLSQRKLLAENAALHQQVEVKEIEKAHIRICVADLQRQLREFAQQVERLTAEREQLDDLATYANENLGWDGVNNSKILSTFLQDYIGDLHNVLHNTRNMAASTREQASAQAVADERERWFMGMQGWCSCANCGVCRHVQYIRTQGKAAGEAG